MALEVGSRYWCRWLVRVTHATRAHNTHFPFSDLNNVEVADLLADYLAEKGLDAR